MTQQNGNDNGNNSETGPRSSEANADSDIAGLAQRGTERFKKNVLTGGPRIVILFIVIALVGIGVWTAFYTVPSDSVAIVQRFGKYLTEVPPGLHIKLPLGIDVATIVPVKRQLKQEFGFATPGASNRFQSPGPVDAKRETQMVTGERTQSILPLLNLNFQKRD